MKRDEKGRSGGKDERSGQGEERRGEGVNWDVTQMVLSKGIISVFREGRTRP